MVSPHRDKNRGQTGSLLNSGSGTCFISLMCRTPNLVNYPSDPDFYLLLIFARRIRLRSHFLSGQVDGLPGFVVHTLEQQNVESLLATILNVAGACRAIRITFGRTDGVA